MEFEHELAIRELNINHGDLPRGLKAKINRFNQMRSAAGDPLDSKKLKDLNTYSAIMADEIQDFYEKDLPDHVERVLTAEEKEQKVSEYRRVRAKLKAKQEN